MDSQEHELREFLRVEVPREIQAILNRGGINTTDWKWLTQEVNDDPTDFRPLNVLMRADALILYPKNMGQQSIGWLTLRKVIALLSFAPGGIEIFGVRFSTEIDGFVEEYRGSSKAGLHK